MLSKRQAHLNSRDDSKDCPDGFHEFLSGLPPVTAAVFCQCYNKGLKVRQPRCCAKGCARAMKGDLSENATQITTEAQTATEQRSEHR